MFKKVVCLMTLVLVLGLVSNASASLVSQWKMDEALWDGTADEVADSVGPNPMLGQFNDGSGGTPSSATGTDEPTTVAVGEFDHAGSYVGNRAGTFDGNWQWIEAIDEASQYIAYDISIASWFSSPDGLVSGRGVILSGLGPHGYSMKLVSDANGFQIALGLKDDALTNPKAWDNVRTYTSDYFTPTTWTHVAVVADYIDGAGADSNSVSFYVDGTQLGSSVALEQAATGTNAFPLVIGAMTDSGHATFKGLLDDVRLYDEALSASAVDAIVPEPATVALLGLGGLALLRRKK